MSKNNQNYNDLFKGLEKDPEYLTECAIVEFTENMARRMGELGVSRSELARRLDTSPAYITKILRGEANFTLKSMVKIAHALGFRLTTHMQPEGASSTWLDVLEKGAEPAKDHEKQIDFKQAQNNYHKVDISTHQKDTANDSVTSAA